MIDVHNPSWATAIGHFVHERDSDPVALATLTWAKERYLGVGFLRPRRSLHGRTCSRAATCLLLTGQERPSASGLVHLACRRHRKRKPSSSEVVVAPGAGRRWRGRIKET
jgi:hypothetical protein